MKVSVFILFALLTLNISMNAQSTSGRIDIMLTQQLADREMGGDTGGGTTEEMPKTRGAVLQAAYASLDNGVISVQFIQWLPFATVTITNEATDEVVYEQSYANPTDLSIDLTGEAGGDYTLEIVSGEMSLTGSFFLDF
ncbi:DUF3244 domain-containing protein [Bacteroides sp. UBA939]|uniref:DUF3244 domain-containing protein n=1 Tax=Bacteroides sp. UBA939 TaxID=1946092 RepID=UPI0025BB3033|nr:DUF3244 domain-containing protein [Bacteroides sp. UBA939]